MSYRLELALPVLVDALEDYYRTGDIHEGEIREQLEAMSLENLSAFLSYARSPELRQIAQEIKEAREAKLTQLPPVPVLF